MKVKLTQDIAIRDSVSTKFQQAGIREVYAAFRIGKEKVPPPVRE